MGPAKETIVDEGSFVAVADKLTSRDPLAFPDYQKALALARERSGRDESVSAGAASIGGHEIEFASFDFSFLGGSMGEVAGERLARGLERATERGVPFVLRTATGGARMQEGMRSLVQMPKVVCARRELADAHRPFIAVLGDPTTGGVLASLGSLADVSVAEADATIGFVGPRVAESVSGRSVGSGSHTGTSAFTHGLVDDLVPGSDVRTYLVGALAVLAPDEPKPVPEPASYGGDTTPDPWAALQGARAPDRPPAPDLVRAWADDLIELRGDRCGSDDPALTAAVLRLHGRRAVVLGLNRAHPPGPAAYRKARRAITIAERLTIPIVTLIDTRGADVSPDSENAGLAWEIAATFESLLHVNVPTVAVVTGEGGSGGALALATCDVLLAYAGSVFSVIVSEAAAEILWRDSSRAEEAARALKVASHDLLALGIADSLIAEPLAPEPLAGIVAYHLDRLGALSNEQRLQRRRERWRDKS